MRYKISGYENGCAMYSLALGTALSIQQANSPENVPDFVKEITPADVSPDNNNGNDSIRKINKTMRLALAQAVRQDLAFKSVTKSNFLPLLIADDDDSNTRNDPSRQSLWLSNKEDIIEMRGKIRTATQTETTTPYNLNATETEAKTNT